MIKYTFLLFTIASCLNLVSQINVNKLSEKNYESVKQTTTYFVIPEFDKGKKQQYFDLLKTIWNFTPIKILTYEESKKIDFSDVLKSKISLRGLEYNSSGAGNFTSWKYGMFFTFYTGKNEKDIAIIEFCSKTSSVINSIDEKSNLLNNIYCNYYLGLLKNDLQLVNNALIKNDNSQQGSINQVIKDNGYNISKDTLFIPDYILDHTRSSIKDVLSKSSFKYKIVSTEILSDIILSNKDVYYLNFVLVGTRKKISIVNSFTGKIIYSSWLDVVFKAKNLSFNSSDVDKINEVLK